jgi:tetratricopeptide (TPR) repeat protein
MKNYDGAIAAFQIAVRDPGLEVEGATMLGQCFTAKGQYDLAVEQYNRAISNRPQLDSTGMQLHYLLASALELMGDKEQALKIYKKLYSNDISFRDVAQKVDALGK